MQQSPCSPASSTARPVLSPDVIQVAVRSSSGDGSCVFVIEAPARGSIADVKRQLCFPPHSMCDDASALELVLKGCIMQGDAALASAVAATGSILTAILLSSSSPRVPTHPLSTCAARAPPASCISAPNAIDCTNRDAIGVALSDSTCASAFGDIPGETALASSSTAKAASLSPAPPAATLQEGSRVCMKGLQEKQQMNGRTGVICGRFNQEIGRWKVAVDASDAGPAIQILIRPVNLSLLCIVDLPQCEAIIKQLGSADAEVQRHALAAICEAISGLVKNKDLFIIAGAADAICNLLLSPTAIVQEQAARCIAALCCGQHVESQNAFRDAGCMPLLVGMMSSSSVDVQNRSCEALLQLSQGHGLNTGSLFDVVSRSDSNSKQHSCSRFISLLRSNTMGSLVTGVLQLIQRIVEADHQWCNEHARNACFICFERCGLSDAVIGLQASTDDCIKKLASECVVTFGILKNVCGDVGADDHVVSAAACIRLRQMLQACICNVVAHTVMGSPALSHLVCMLASANTSVVEDCAVCIGLLSDWSRKFWHKSKHDEFLARVSKLLQSLVDHDAGVNVQYLHSILSVASSEGGSVCAGLLVVLESFLLNYGNDAIIRQFVNPPDILPICLGIMQSSPTSDCFLSVVLILRKILQSEHSQCQSGSGSLNPYIARLNSLGAVQALQCSPCVRAADTGGTVDQVLQCFYEFLPLDEKLRVMVSQRAVSPAVLRCRPKSLISSSMRGDLCSIESHSEWFNIDKMQRIVRFFVSSTFDDTKHERDVLIKCVMPAAQRYARAVGFEIVMSEMRFGIRRGLSDDHKTTEVCMAELHRCAELSAGLSYVLLSCNRYGFRASPRRIPACDMDGLLSVMTTTERAITLEYYSLDENAVTTPQDCYNITVNMHGALNIAGAVYVLNSVNSVQDFWPRFNSLQSALRNAADRYWPNASSALLREAQSQHPVKFFFCSITEEEICRGLFWRDCSRIAGSVHVFQRSLFASGGDELQRMPAHSPELKNYIDMSSDKTTVDLESARLLKEQQQMILQFLSQSPSCLTAFAPLQWRHGKGIDPSDPHHAAYLEQFAEKALALLLNSVDNARQRLAVEAHVDMAEAIFHLQFAAHRAKHFSHSCETRLVTNKLSGYLGRASGDGCAFVIYGASGSGKTFLMAEAADREARALKSSRGAVVVRFLGTSPASSGLADLLGSLCRQLHSISGAATVLPSNDDVEKLKQSFEHALKTWQTGRLTLFLDSLDQLDSTAGGRLLSWLPTHALSPHVRLVVSTLSDETAPSDGKPFACLSILQNRYANLFSEYAVEVQPVSDVRFLLLHHLQIHKRKLSDTQLRVLEAAVNVSPKMQTPLVIGILAVRFSDWPSHRDFPHDNKNLDGTLFIDTTSVRALIKQEFKALEAKHGSELVRAALSFITLAKDGVSETELSEILSLDDDVLASVYEWWVPPVRTLPTNPLTMLLVDLKPYLAKRGAINGCGGLMMQWYHRQFWEAAHEYCFCDAREFRYRHAQLGEFFSGTWADRSKPYNCNLKAAVQKKMAGEVSGDRRVRPQPLCLREGKNIFMTRGDAGAVNARRSRAAVHHFLAAGKLSEAADELCSFEGICGRVLCGEGSVLMQQLIHLGECIRSCIRLRNFQAAHQLRRVEHFTNWLRRDISVIISDPYTEIFASCSRQPEVSLARMELQAYMQLTSAGISASCDDAWHARSFVLGPVLRNFDRCISQMRFHKLGVNCVAFNFDSSLLASASEDGWVALWNPATSLVEGVLKGVAVQRCHSIAAKPGAFDDLMKMMKMGIKSVSWNPDGSLLATGHLDDTVRIWNVSTQQEVAVLRGHKSWIDSVSFCEEGKYVASGSFDCTVRLWDLRTRREMAILTGHTAGIRSVQWKGSFVASGSLDTTVRIWNSSTRKVAAVLKGHSRGVCCLAFDASGKLVASGSEDCTIRLWDVVRMQTVAVLKGHTAYVLSVAFAPNGKLIASGSDDRTVRLWDSSTFKGIAMHTATDIGWAHSVTFDKSSTILASGHEDGTIRLCSVSMQEEEVQELRDEVVCVAFDRSGRYLAAGFYNSIQVWEAFTQQKIAVIRSPASAAGWGSHTIHGRNVGWGICHVAFDGSGKRIASGSVDKTIRLWDIRTQRQVALFRGHSARIASVAFDGSNKHIASGSDDKTVRLWSVGEGREVAVFTAHTEKVTSVAFDGSGKYVASGSADMTVRLWSVRLLCEVAVLRGHTDTVWSVACDMSGMYIASGSRDWTVRLWDVSAQKAIAVLRGPTHKDGDGFDGVMSVAFDGSGKYIASGSDDKSIRLWDVRTRQEVALFKGHTGNITSVAFDWSGRFIASSAVNAVFFPDDNTVRLWDTGMRQVISKQFGGPVENRLVELDWSGHYVASLSPDDFTIRLWDVSKQQQVLLLKGHAKAVLAMAFDGSNKHIASGSDDKTVRLWSVGEGREVAVFTAHTEKVTSVAFDGSGKYVASGSADMTVRLWDVSNHSAVACLKGLSSHITSICFSPTSALIAAGSDDGCVCVWNAPSGATVVNYTANTRVALLCLTWSTDEVLLAVGSCDGSITLSKVSSGVQCAVLQCPEAAAISGIALSYDACLLAAAVTATSCVHVFDVASALPLGTCELRGSARQLLWGADGVLRDGQGQLWKLQ